MRLRYFTVYLCMCACFIFLFFSCSTTGGLDVVPENFPTEELQPKDTGLAPEGTEVDETDVAVGGDEKAAGLDTGGVSGEPSNEPVVETPTPSRLVLTFGGDIMAHTPNFSMDDYSMIYADIEEIIKNDDLSFANLETPVHGGRPYESYPTFNVQPPYAQAAIDAGFDVFSLANNHTNDQGYEGMEETLGFFQPKEAEGVYAAGIKPEGHRGFSYQLIEFGQWKVLFVALTEILNSFADYEKLDYVAPNANRRKTLAQELTQLRQDNPCDLFVVSLHTCEDEYVHEITQVRRDFYRLLLDNSVDIVWANHPHLAKEWEVFTAQGEEFSHAVAMYALGNTISGQRRDPQFTKPETNRDYTGDGYLIQVVVEKDAPPPPSAGVTSATAPLESDAPYKPNFRIVEVVPHLITTYIDGDNNYLIRRLTDDFIQELRDQGNQKWADYLAARKALMERIGRKDVVR